jgi:hypothetical protein
VTPSQLPTAASQRARSFKRAASTDHPAAPSTSATMKPTGFGKRDVSASPVSPRRRASAENTTLWYCERPRMPRVLKAAYCVLGREFAVPMPS